MNPTPDTYIIGHKDETLPNGYWFEWHGPVDGITEINDFLESYIPLFPWKLEVVEEHPWTESKLYKRVGDK